MCLSAELPAPAHIALDRGFSNGDSATAAEVAALLRDGDSWLYDSSCGRCGEMRLGVDEALCS